MKRVDILIDFEFTGLDNTFTKDNEIIQMKALNIDTGNHICMGYSSRKPLGATAISYGLMKTYGSRFSASRMQEHLAKISEGNVINFYGYGISQDVLMLQKYDIKFSHTSYVDLREELQLSKHEERLATEGSKLEAAYYIVTGTLPSLHTHNGVEELFLMKDIYLECKKIRKKKYLTIMPHGHCAGMPISQYVSEYRRAADGYRYNNNDLLAATLNNYIQKSEEVVEEDDLL